MKKEKEVTAEVEVSKAIDKLWKPLLTALVAGAIGYGGFIGYLAFEKSNENKAQEKLFAIQKELEDKTTALTKPDEENVADASKVAAKDKKDDKATPAKTPAAPKEIEKSPESLVKNFENEIKSFETFIESNRGHKAAYMAAVQLAGLAVTYKDLGRAEKVLSGVVADPKSGLFSGLLKSQLASVLMDQKKYAEAIEYFNNLVEDKSQTYFHPQALLRLGTCYLETGDFEKSESMFKRVSADFPKTQASNDAKNLIKLLALKKGEKN